ncbi:MAG: helix-turn-helix domain-containing protein [Gemmatimonas sp.]|jgi:AraC family transcriptional regulator
MVRAFAAATGFSVMRYVRARRLSEAARALARGAPDILSLALEADYGSHEAFTRAFRDHFGMTPEAVPPRRRSCQASAAPRDGFRCTKALSAQDS